MKEQTAPNIPETDSAGVKVMPPSVFLSCLLSGICLEIIFSWPLVLGNWLIMSIVGTAITSAGLYFMMWGHGRFQALGVNVPTNMPVSRLVTDGAHKYSRNPMYVGFISILIGFGLAAGSIWIFVAALPMALYLAFYVVPREEAYLTRTFGEKYETYRKSVRRWL